MDTYRKEQLCVEYTMPSKEEINKYLTEELFGECWHESDGRLHCKKCDSFLYAKCPTSRIFNNDFFTWEGFGKLWTWMQGSTLLEAAEITINGNMIHQDLIHPKRLTTAVYKFLREKNDAAS